MKTTKAWHFCRRARTRLRTSNGDLLIPKDGVWLEHKGDVKMCESGLHASKRLIDALEYAQDTTICRVELRDIVEEGEDKLVARQRRVLWHLDGEVLLRAFARRCALDVIDEWDAPEVVLQWLKTGDEQHRKASLSLSEEAVVSAVGAAARSVADVVAWTASELSSFSMARYVSWSAARSAADAADAAARSAAGSAARTTQNRRLVSMVMAEHRKQGRKS